MYICWGLEPTPKDAAGITVALDDLSWTLYPLVPIWSLAASCVEFSSKHHGSMVWRCKSCIPGRVSKVCYAIVNAALSGVLATRLED